MRGVCLAGGEGTRLRPATEAYNKHATLVYDKPMIYYPLETLRSMGCDEAIIVTSPNGIGSLAKLVGDGGDFGMRVEYTVQEKATGMAGALACAKVKDDVFPVVAGDCYYDPQPVWNPRPTVFWNDYEFANQHGIFDPETRQIIEKPLRDVGRMVIIGCYIYDQRVFEVIEGLEPSARGELEITDINNWYLNNGADFIEAPGFFGDMGTPDGLLRVANHIKENSEQQLQA